MKKCFRKVMCLSLVVACVLSMGVMASAAAPVGFSVIGGGMTINASNYISSYSASLSSSGGTVTPYVMVRGTGVMTSIGATRIVLYESSNGGSSWSLVKTFTSATSTSMLTSNSTLYSASPVSYSGVSGRQYYAIVTVYAANSSGSDSKTYTTSVITAK